jgi:hypothetical protein
MASKKKVSSRPLSRGQRNVLSKVLRDRDAIRRKEEEGRVFYVPAPTPSPRPATPTTPPAAINANLSSSLSKPRVASPLSELATQLGINRPLLQRAKRGGIPDDDVYSYLQTIAALPVGRKRPNPRLEKWINKRLALKRRTVSPAGSPKRSLTRASSSASVPLNTVAFEGARIYVTDTAEFLFVNRRGAYALHRHHRSGPSRFSPSTETVQAIRIDGDKLKVASVFGREWTWTSLGPYRGYRDGSAAEVIEPQPGTVVVSSEPPSTERLQWDPLAPDWWMSLPGSPHAPVQRRGGKKSALLYERIEFLSEMGAAKWYAGRHLASPRYYVADFGTLAVAECVDEGNALYCVRPRPLGWRSVLHGSKQRALELGAIRIQHRGDWQRRVRQLLTAQH